MYAVISLLICKSCSVCQVDMTSSSSITLRCLNSILNRSTAVDIKRPDMEEGRLHRIRLLGIRHVSRLKVDNCHVEQPSRLKILVADLRQARNHLQRATRGDITRSSCENSSGRRFHLWSGKSQKRRYSASRIRKSKRSIGSASKLLISGRLRPPEKPPVEPEPRRTDTHRTDRHPEKVTEGRPWRASQSTLPPS